MPRHTDPNKVPIWRQRLADFDRSGLSVVSFCQNIGCSSATFYHWKRKLSQAAAPSAFLRVQTAEPQPAFLQIDLPSGVSLRVPMTAVASLGVILEQVG